MTELDPESAELRVWFALRDLEQSFRGMLACIPAEPHRLELWEDYKEKRLALAGPVERFKQALCEALGGGTAFANSFAARSYEATLIHYDERELARRQEGQPESALFQTEFCGLYDGGEIFIQYLEDSLRASGTPALVLELLLFCMRSGFCGRYSDLEDPERKAKLEELCQRVAAEGPAPERRETVPTVVKPIDGQGLPWGYYAGALALLGILWGGFQVVAWEQENTELGSKPCDLK